MRAGRPALLAGLVLVLAAGCGGAGNDADDARSVAGAISSAVSAAPSQAPPQASAGSSDRCGQAQAEIQTAVAVLFKDVVGDIDVDGCRLATITTTLGATAGDIATARDICQYAANEASSHDVAATSVVQAGGPELAAGTTAADCAGRPAS